MILASLPTLTSTATGSLSPADGAGYASNGRHVNHYLVSFLGRIAGREDGLNLEPMLYQVRTLSMGYSRRG